VGYEINIARRLLNGEVGKPINFSKNELNDVGGNYESDANP
jgi:hypothetical protein